MRRALFQAPYNSKLDSFIFIQFHGTGVEKEAF